MLSTLELILITCAVIIISALTIYALFLLKALKKQQKKQEKDAQEKVLASQNHDNKVLDSVVIIARAMESEQCDFSEGSWRLCVLLDSLKTSSEHVDNFPAIYALYNTIKDLSILDARKNLPKQKRMKEDLIRAKAEANLTSDISAELPILLTYVAELKNGLTDIS